MLFSPEKMPINCTDQWPQIEQRAGAMPSTTKLMERSPQDQQQQQQQQQQPLKCPRCDSANTKFCYYNNYSLSQPRHFCKACKRYWTRGGTLRNVPVGGGCRKNKRVKRQGQSEQTPLSANQSPPRSDPAAGYGLTGAPSEVTGLNFPTLRSGFPGMNMENMSMPMSSTGYDLPPQISSLWMNMHYPGNDSEYQTGLHPNHVQGSHAASSLFPDFSLLGSSASSFITSTLQHQQHKLLMGLRETETSRPSNDFQVFFPMGELDQGGNGSSGNIKGEKMEEESVAVGNKMGNWQVPYDNSMENIGSDSSFYWASNGVGVWQDSSSYGPSSIAPLI